MANFVQITNTTLVSGATATNTYLAVEINNKKAGIPIYTFTYSYPDIDLIIPETDIHIKDATVYDSATAFNAGIALTINTSSFAVPLYKIVQEDFHPTMEFETPTIVSNLTATGKYMIVDLDETAYGIPLYNYNSLYPFTTTADMSSISVNTVIRTGKKVLDVNDSQGYIQAGSTYLNSKLRAYSDLIIRIKKNLGWPAIELDICDENISTYIDQAIELYTKYAGYTEEYLIFHSSKYTRGCGIKMDDALSQTPNMCNTCYGTGSASQDYDLESKRKVIDVFSINQGQGTGVNTLFSIEQSVAQQTYFGALLGGTGFDLTTWTVLKQWLDLREILLAQRVHFQFFPDNQVLKLLPEPFEGENYHGLIGCYVEKAIKELIKEPWVFQYALALTMTNIGIIRGKYTGIQIGIMGGGATLNYNDMLIFGKDQKTALEKQLFDGTGFLDAEPPKFFVG